MDIWQARIEDKLREAEVFMDGPTVLRGSVAYGEASEGLRSQIAWMLTWAFVPHLATSRIQFFDSTGAEAFSGGYP